MFLRYFLSLDALLTDVNVLGLSEFKVLDGDFQLSKPDFDIKFNMNLTWPLISGNSAYRLVSNIIGFRKFYGNGYMK